jgi:hypothetical protein
MAEKSKITFLAKCVFFMANNLEQELNIDGILLKICSTCICCPGQRKKICFLSDNVRQRSSSNFSMRGILLKNEESTEFWKISCASVICTKKATQKMSIIRINILPCILL